MDGGEILLRATGPTLELKSQTRWTPLFTFAEEIAKFEVIPGKGIVVALKVKPGPAAIKRNIFMLDFAGTEKPAKLKWQVPPSFFPDFAGHNPSGKAEDTYSGFEFSKGKLTVFAQYGDYYIVDLDTGQFLQRIPAK